MNSQNNRLSLTTYWVGVLIASGIIFLGLVLISQLVRDGLYPLASTISAIIIFFGIIVLQRKFSAYRWLMPAIALVITFTIYPIISTVLISFENMSGGNVITKQQAIQRLESRTFLPESADTYSWAAYSNSRDDLLFIFKGTRGAIFYGKPGETLESLEDFFEFGDLGSDGLPLTIEEYNRLALNQIVPQIERLSTLRFPVAEGEIRIQSIRQAAELKQKFMFQLESNAIIDLETGILYTALNGAFTSATGERLVPGFRIFVGFTNYQRFLGNPGFITPIGRILLWNIAYAFFVVLLSFVLGLMIALIFEKLPGRRVIRTLLLLPYPVPVLVSIVVWRALLNESSGLITTVLRDWFGSSPAFFTDRNWTRVAIILINIYLAYPYFYVISSGALRSISSEIFEAAEIDGANPWIKLRYITLPLVLRILTPLLIASYSFNFNNFTLIWGFNAGLPAMADTILPMGHTDLLISFIYRLGFSAAGIPNYSLAAAITVLLFLLVAAMLIIQLHSTKALEDKK